MLLARFSHTRAPLSKHFLQGTSSYLSRATSHSRRVYGNNKQIRFYCSGVESDDDILRARLSVLGVGGAGCNAVNTMIKRKDLTELEFFVTNTDAQSLMTSECPKEERIQIGRELTKCLGAGANPQVGKQAAEEDLETIVSKIGNTNMCFITAGMGGGTGTGAAPVIAKALKDKGILTIGMVCMPFRFEGKRKMNLALGGIKEMQQAVDTLIVVQNERLLLTLNQDKQKDKSKRVSLQDSFKMVDDIFYEGIKAVTDVIVKPGLINLDFADVRTITEGPGWGIMGSGFAEGHGRAEVATKMALDNPLLSDTSKRNATGVLVSITGGTDLAILEVDEVLRLIRQEVSEEANVIFGATSDDDMKGAIRVSLILTGPYDQESDSVVSSVNEQAADVKPDSAVYPPPHYSQEVPKQAQTAAPRPSQVFQVAPPGEQLSMFPNKEQPKANDTQATQQNQQTTSTPPASEAAQKAEWFTQYMAGNEIKKEEAQRYHDSLKQEPAQQFQQPRESPQYQTPPSYEQPQQYQQQQPPIPGQVQQPPIPEQLQQPPQPSAPVQPQQTQPPPAQPQKAQSSWWNTWRS